MSTTSNGSDSNANVSSGAGTGGGFSDAFGEGFSKGAAPATPNAGAGEPKPQTTAGAGEPPQPPQIAVAPFAQDGEPQPSPEQRKQTESILDKLRKGRSLPQLIAHAERQHELIKGLTVKGATYARFAGLDLIEAEKLYAASKQKGEPSWTDWSAANVKIPASTRSHYKRIAEHWDLIEADAKNNLDTEGAAEEMSQCHARRILERLDAQAKAVNPKGTESVAQPVVAPAEQKAEADHLHELKMLENVEPQGQPVITDAPDPQPDFDYLLDSINTAFKVVVQMDVAEQKAERDQLLKLRQQVEHLFNKLNTILENL